MLSDWEAKDLLDALLSPPATLSSCQSSPVLHDHTYSLPQDYVSVEVGEWSQSGAGGEGPRAWLFTRALLQTVGAVVRRRRPRYVPRSPQSRYWA